MKIRLIHIWDLFKLLLPFYMNLFHLSLGDMHALQCRAEDRRMKNFRIWIEQGSPMLQAEEQTEPIHAL